MAWFLQEQILYVSLNEVCAQFHFSPLLSTTAVDIPNDALYISRALLDILVTNMFAWVYFKHSCLHCSFHEQMHSGFLILFSAVDALEWFDSFMNRFLVFIQIIFSITFKITKFTLEWLDSFMNRFYKVWFYFSFIITWKFVNSFIMFL